jgi:hypothetical protein
MRKQGKNHGNDTHGSFSEGGRGLHRVCGELPGANTQGATLEEARENLREAVQLVLEANRLFSGKSPGGVVILEPLIPVRLIY